MTHKMLVVDDESAVIEELVGYLSQQGYSCADAPNVGTALEIIRQDSDIGIILSDINMPGSDGLELLSAVQTFDDRDFEVIMFTGQREAKAAIDALRLGANDYLEKPINLQHMLHVVRRADQTLYLRRSERLLQESLASQVEARTAHIQFLITDLERAHQNALDCLATAAEFKDPETGNHIKRIGAYAGFLAAKLEWPEQRRRVVELAAPLHDVGKIGTPEAVLLKPGKLTPDEVAIMKQHAEIGGRILSRSDDPVMKCAANIALAHHERWDGTGYPRGLRGNEIPIEARITALGDIYDALRSVRPYKPAFDHENAVSIILEGDGRTALEHFDPEHLEIFRAHADGFSEIFESLAG